MMKISLSITVCSASLFSASLLALPLPKSVEMFFNVVGQASKPLSGGQSGEQAWLYDQSNLVIKGTSLLWLFDGSKSAAEKFKKCELYINDKLISAGVPVPRMISGGTGINKKIAVVDNNEIYSAYEYLEDKVSGLSEAEKEEQKFDTLMKFQKVMGMLMKDDEYYSCAEALSKKSPLALALRMFENMNISHLKMMVKDVSQDGDKAMQELSLRFFLLYVHEYVIKELNELKNNYYSLLHREFVHGDLNSKNFVHADGKAYLIDWDNMHYGNRIYDWFNGELFPYWTSNIGQFNLAAFLDFEKRVAKSGNLTVIDDKSLIPVFKLKIIYFIMLNLDKSYKDLSSTKSVDPKLFRLLHDNFELLKNR